MIVGLLTGLLAKSAVIAGAGLLLALLLRGRPASERVDVLRAAVCVLLALPLIQVFGPDLRVEALPAASASAALPATSAPGTVTVLGGLMVTDTLRPPSLAEAAIGLWLLGAAVVLGRFAIGVLTLWRWTRTGSPVTDPVWTAALGRLAPRRQPKLIAAAAVEAPLSWGLPPGVVLVGRSCLARPESAPAVLAHELAHVRRGDWLFLALSRLALALFWFNPLVWLLHVALADRTEDAADAAAIATVDRRTYAHALVGLAADFRQSAAVGMAGDVQSLTRRINRIMTVRLASRTRPLAVTLTIGALIAVATPIAALEIGRRPPAPPAPPQAPSAPPAPPAPPAFPSYLALPVPPAPPAPPAPPSLQDGGRITISEDGRTRVYNSVEEMDPETRREYEQALAEAAEARVHAAEARVHAAAARREAARIRASIDHEGIARSVAEARASADHARARAAEAREEARHAMAQARVEMRKGADEMDRGAQQMREEAVRLRDPAYRARQIEENRARGNTVTDAELVDLSRRLPRQADEMEEQAQRMRERSAERT